MDKGYVHVYTGNGKGKTTCALGLTVRAVGAGLRVYIGQFLKEGLYSEIYAIDKYLPGVLVEQYGAGLGFVSKDSISDDDVQVAREGHEKAMAALTSGEYDIVILDEINVAQYLGLLTQEEVIGLIENKPYGTELILTGRHASEAVIERAELVTEMTEIKHYFTKGVTARIGIEK